MPSLTSPVPTLPPNLSHSCSHSQPHPQQTYSHIPIYLALNHLSPLHRRNRTDIAILSRRSGDPESAIRVSTNFAKSILRTQVPIGRQACLLPYSVSNLPRLLPSRWFVSLRALTVSPAFHNHPYASRLQPQGRLAQVNLSHSLPFAFICGRARYFSADLYLSRNHIWFILQGNPSIASTFGSHLLRRL